MVSDLLIVVKRPSMPPSATTRSSSSPGVAWSTPVISTAAPCSIVIVPEIFSKSLTVGVSSRSRFDPVRNITSPFTVIVPGEAPGDSVPRTSISALTVPADPKVAPVPTRIADDDVIVVPAWPIRRPPVIEILSQLVSSVSDTTPLLTASRSKSDTSSPLNASGFS